MTEPQGSERRQHSRVQTEIPCTLIGQDGQSEAFELVDLSESGVRIRCDRAVPAMTRIKVAMAIPGERVGTEGQANLDTDGVVVWSHPVDGGRFDTGVFFPELDERNRALLRAFVASAGAADAEA